MIVIFTYNSLMQKERLKKTHQKLYKWYALHGRRELPWRHTDDPYKIWISEVMLQQTQVKTVLERYYFPFLERFETLESLANAPLDDLLKIWEGLGYYSRARNLHRAAQIASPALPRSYEALLRLPGIGPNTATAICAFAYKEPVAVMEANVRRILCRIHRLKYPTEKELRSLAHDLLDIRNPFDYNQAIMDIGAIVCTPRDPSCPVCPFSRICGAFKEKRFDYPEKRAKKVPVRKIDILIPYHEKQVAMRKREGRFLHGLWGFEESDTPPEGATRIGEVSQSYTHFRLEGTLYLTRDPSSLPYFSKARIAKLALSGVDKKIVKILENEGYLQ